MGQETGTEEQARRPRGRPRKDAVVKPTTSKYRGPNNEDIQALTGMELGDVPAAAFTLNQKKGGVQAQTVPSGFNRDIQQRVFIHMFSMTGNVTLSAATAGVSRRTPYNWAKEDIDFEDAWDEAKEAYYDSIEMALGTEAKKGNIAAQLAVLRKAGRYEDSRYGGNTQAGSEWRQQVPQLAQEKRAELSTMFNKYVKPARESQDALASGR